MKTAFGLVLGLLSSALTQGQVVKLSDEVFDGTVLQGGEPWLVAFGSSTSELESLAKVLDGSGVRVGTVGSEEQCGKGKTGLKFYGPSADSKSKSVKSIASSLSKIDVGSIVDKVFKELHQSVAARVVKTSTGKKKSKQFGSKPVDLDDNSFDQVVMNADEAFMVAFVAPWCGHCKALAPEFLNAAKQLEGSGVVLAQVDATSNERLASRFEIQGFPTIKFFPPGVLNKDDSKAIDYQMERSADAISSWALAEFERFGGKVSIEIPEINSQSDFDEVCSESKCVLVFLPDLLDSGKQGREEYIEQIKAAQRSVRHIKFGWIAAGSQPAWEEAYNLRFGFPAVLYLRKHQSKKLGLIMRGSTLNSLDVFASTPKALGEFEEAGWPELATTSEWDGQEAQPPEEDDDFDLDEFLNS